MRVSRGAHRVQAGRRIRGETGVVECGERERWGAPVPGSVGANGRRRACAHRECVLKNMEHVGYGYKGCLHRGHPASHLTRSLHPSTGRRLPRLESTATKLACNRRGVSGSVPARCPLHCLAAAISTWAPGNLVAVQYSADKACPHPSIRPSIHPTPHLAQGLHTRTQAPSQRQRQRSQPR